MSATDDVLADVVKPNPEGTDGSASEPERIRGIRDRYLDAQEWFRMETDVIRKVNAGTLCLDIHYLLALLRGKEQLLDHGAKVVTGLSEWRRMAQGRLDAASEQISQILSDSITDSAEIERLNAEVKQHRSNESKRFSRIREVIERVDGRALAADGPVPPTEEEITGEEMREIYRLAGGKPVEAQA